MASATSPASRAAPEDFATLLDEMLGANTGFAGSVVTGKIIRIDDDFAVVDVGLKSEGRVPLKE
ncbi:MAG: S1 RNA-binding domain-containing protein, partial [Roseococcus sp.]